MLIVRREDGLYESGLVYTTIQGKKVAVCDDTYVGATRESVLNQAYGNALVRQWRASLSQKLSTSGRR